MSATEVLSVPILQPIHQEDIYQPIRRTLHIIFSSFFLSKLSFIQVDSSTVSMMSARKQDIKCLWLRDRKTLEEETLSGGSKSGPEAHQSVRARNPTREM